MPALNNATSGDGYSAGNEVQHPGSVRATLVVANAAIYYQLGRGRPGVVYGPDEVLAVPGFYTLGRRLDGLRFRSAAPGVPAQVSVQLLDAGDVGGP